MTNMNLTKNRMWTHVLLYFMNSYEYAYMLVKFWFRDLLVFM